MRRYVVRPGGFGRGPGPPGAGGFRPPGAPGGFQFSVTPWVKRLLAVNAAVFLISVAVGPDLVVDLFAFQPGRFLARPWGMATYMFVHGGLWHLLMNLLVIFFFGPPLESRWGSGIFVRFYLVCGLGGVLLSFLFVDAAIVGASAACYGLMLAFAMTWPNAPIHIWGVVPVKAKWLVGFLAALSFVSAVGPTRDGVAHLAHLGGVVAGFLFMKSGWLDAGGVGQAGGAGRAGSAGQASDRKAQGRRKPMQAAPPRVAEALERRRAEKRAAEERAQLDAVDAVLDKISAHGVESLTADERDLLDRVSRKQRTN